MASSSSDLVTEPTFLEKPWPPESPMGDLPGTLHPWAVGSPGLKDPTEVGSGLQHWVDGMWEAEDLSQMTDPPLEELQPQNVRWLSASLLHRLDAHHAESSSPEHGSASSSTTPSASICGSLDPGGLIPGMAGDRWMLAALFALAGTEPGRRHLRSALAACPSSLEGSDGPYELRLHDPRNGFQPITVRLNDRVPCCRFSLPASSTCVQGFGWRPCFIGNLRNETWPMLLEKGVALLLGRSFLALAGANWLPLAWAAITGEPEFHYLAPWPLRSKARASQAGGFWAKGQFQNEVGRQAVLISCKPTTGTDDLLTEELAWQRLRLLCQDGQLAACRFLPESSKCGLLAEHAYIVIAARQLSEPKPSQRSLASAAGTHPDAGCGDASSLAVGGQNRFRFVQLQSPWAGASEWRGAWAVGGPEWRKHPWVASELWDSGRDNNNDTFWMAWGDFCLFSEGIVFSAEAPATTSETSASECLWSASPRLETASAEAFGVWHGPDLWQDLCVTDPEVLQEDLSSWPDGMSEQRVPLEKRVFGCTEAEVRWISASRVHRLVKYAEADQVIGDLADEDSESQRWWAGVAVLSDATGNAKVCSRVAPSVMRSSVGNCWLVAAVASLSTMPEIIESIFAGCPSDPLELRDGSYKLLLHDPSAGFAQTAVLLNDRIPCFPRYSNGGRLSGWRPCFSTSLFRQMWPLLLEKGVARLLGGYHHLDGNEVPLSWAILTGQTSCGVFFPWPGSSSRVPDCQDHSTAATPANNKNNNKMWGAGTFDLRQSRCKYRYRPQCSNELNEVHVREQLHFLSKDRRSISCTFASLGAAEEGAEADDLIPMRSYAILRLRLLDSMAAPRQRRGTSTVQRPSPLWLKLLGPWSGREQLSLRRERKWASRNEVGGFGEEPDEDEGDDSVFWMTWEEFSSRVSAVVFSDKPYPCRFAASTASTRTAPEHHDQRQNQTPQTLIATNACKQQRLEQEQLQQQQQLTKASSTAVVTAVDAAVVAAKADQTDNSDTRDKHTDDLSSVLRPASSVYQPEPRKVPTHRLPPQIILQSPPPSLPPPSVPAPVPQPSSCVYQPEPLQVHPHRLPPQIIIQPPPASHLVPPSPPASDDLSATTSKPSSDPPLQSPAPSMPPLLPPPSSPPQCMQQLCKVEVDCLAETLQSPAPCLQQEPGFLQAALLLPICKDRLGISDNCWPSDQAAAQSQKSLLLLPINKDSSSYHHLSPRKAGAGVTPKAASSCFDLDSPAGERSRPEYRRSVSFQADNKDEDEDEDENARPEYKRSGPFQDFSAESNEADNKDEDEDENARPEYKRSGKFQDFSAGSNEADNKDEDEDEDENARPEYKRSGQFQDFSAESNEADNKDEDEDEDEDDDDDDYDDEEEEEEEEEEEADDSTTTPGGEHQSRNSSHSCSSAQD
ncbi:unnamed protein product, partial [Polarella glacialis]